MERHVIESCLILVGLAAVATTCDGKYDCSDPRIQSEGVKWNKTERLWMYPAEEQASDCPGLKQPFRTRQDLVNLLHGKHIMFVGDSTVRNLAQMTFGLLCNPTYLEACGQRIHYPFQDDNLVSGMNCTRADLSPAARAKVEGRMMRRYGEVLPNVCNSEVKFLEVELKNLTEAKMYRTHTQRRKAFWIKKKIPPMLTIQFKGFTASVIEAGCMEKGNKIERVLKYLREARRRFMEDGIQTPVPKFDLLVTSAAYHCSLDDFHRTEKRNRFYMTIPRELRRMRTELGTKVLWTETPYCSNEPNMDSDEARRKRSPCSEYPRVKADVMRGLQPEGPRAESAIPVTPVFWITKGGEPVEDILKPLSPKQEKAPCMFADPLHPSLPCYRAVTTAFIKSVAMVLEIPNPPRNSATAAEDDLVVGTQPAATGVEPADDPTPVDPTPTPSEVATTKSPVMVTGVSKRLVVARSQTSERVNSDVKGTTLLQAAENQKASLVQRSFSETSVIVLLLAPLVVGVVILKNYLLAN